MTAMESAVEKVLRSPQVRYTQEEAEKRLREIGVLDKNNRVQKKYQEVFVRADGRRAD